MSAPLATAASLPVVHRGASSWEGIDSERVLRVLMHNLDGMVFRCAIDAQWTLRLVSDGCRQLTGYGADELVGNKVISLEQLTHAADR